jgi:hypothetical protein
MGFQRPGKVEPTPKREYIPCEVASETRDKALGVITDAIVNDPRSLQKAIGPSEIGDPCEYCLANRLAGTPEKPEVAWLTYAGKAVHAQLERDFRRAGLPWLPEARNLVVGEIDGIPVKGTSDILHFQDGCGIDWKYVGSKTMTKVRHGGPPAVYRAQGHLYGRGWSLLGFKVNHVGIFFLPREAQSLSSAVWWAEAYDEQIALEALARADALAKRINTFGLEAVLPELEKLPGCYDCKRWELP